MFLLRSIRFLKITMMDYSDENLNFFRVCDITANVITEGLRCVFKQEWDNKFQSTFGKWNDTIQNGQDFEKQEPSKSKKRNAKLLSIMINGKTEEWDCTALCFGILYSNSIGTTLNPVTDTHVNSLRELRNEVFAHISKGATSDADFQSFISRVEAAFLGLNLDVETLRASAHQKSFPTTERILNQLKEEQKLVSALQQKSSALEEELNFKPKKFLGNLPPKPSHVIQDRQSEIATILQHMKELKSSSNGEITTIYLSGNPGCGKSQLARMVGKAFYKHVSTNDLAFVATLNAETLETLFNSYDSFSRALGCTEYAVSKITTSNDKTEEKLGQFQRLVSPKMREFSTWLLIIDNVVDLKTVRLFWPSSGSNEHGDGHVLVTTQDSDAIPNDALHSWSMCLSRGMNPEDAVTLLTDASQMKDCKDVEKVAEALDYQPLALACAGWYMSNVRSRGGCNFTWARYLSKLKDGKEETMGEIKKKCESGYTRSMPVAVRMAVERTVTSEPVLLYTFQFLSVCAPAPIPLEVVIEFVAERMPNLDAEDIAPILMDSSLLQISSKGDSRPTLWLHQVVNRVIKSNAKVKIQAGKPELEMISTALGPLHRLTKEDSSNSKIFAEHVSAYVSYVISFGHSCLNLYEEMSKVTQLSHFLECFISCATMCLKYGKLSVVKQCLEAVRQFMKANTDIAINKDISYLLHFFCGQALAEQSKFKDAIEYFKEALEIRRRSFDTNSQAVAECLRQLGRANYNLSQGKEAREYYNEALAIFRKNFGEKHKDVARCLIGLGNLENNQAEALPYYHKALSISKELFGEQKQIEARCLHNIGVTCTFLCRYDDAEKHLNDALVLLCDIYGERHEETAICLCNLGRVHLFCSRFEKARDLLEKALKIRQEIGNELRVARNLFFLGQLSQKEGEISTAEESYTKALDTFRSFKFPENHLYVKEAVSALQEIGIRPEIRKRKAEDLVGRPDQPPRQAIKC